MERNSAQINSEIKKLYRELAKVQETEKSDFVNKAYHIPSTVVFLYVYGIEKGKFRVVHVDTESNSIYLSQLEFDNSALYYPVETKLFIEVLQGQVDFFITLTGEKK